MRKKSRAVLILFFTICIIADSSLAETVTAHWGGNAHMIYDSGFMHMLKKCSGDDVCLFNMELIHNDAPGAGASEKGVWSDVIWGKNRARKHLMLDDPRTNKAWLVIFTIHQGKYPLQFEVNGKSAQVDNWNPSKNQEIYRWAEFPAECLKKGRNIIDLYCPEAQSEQEGWEIYIARADEFEEGGGNPADVGKSSFKSRDGGESWKESPFGPLGQTRAEYSVRISLDRYVNAGWLATPIIDLWKGNSENFIVPLREINKVEISMNSEVPEETSVEYFLRKGPNPDPFSSDWGPYEYLGDGKSISLNYDQNSMTRRYIQLRAELKTTNPLKSPVVKSAYVSVEMNQRVPLNRNIHIIEADNEPIKYSSIDWEWEKWDRPEFKELRKLENLDEVVAVSRTEFDAQVKLLDYVTKRWRHSNPQPEYPGWDAKSILNRIDNAGGGGMCIQFNNTLGGLCMTFGWQARLVNVVGHEICEVWNDEYGKWIFLDADYENNYNYDPNTAEPLNMLDLHNRYLDYYFPEKPIDWMNDMIKWMNPIDGKSVPVSRGSLSQHKTSSYIAEGTMSGFCNAAFMRMVPRNNWYEKPYPRPLAHGSSWWPWDGYINWYDDRTPPKRQYSWHTDRPRDMWPDLNKVHVDATSSLGNDRIFLRFETYTPNFSHFEVNVDDEGWKAVSERWTWLLQSGRNTLRIRAVSKLGVKGKPSSFVVNHADAPFDDYLNY
ncbi:MAG: transglutaminase domain-containing protein [Candidatus Latescibacteria bacterium]|nr:transglutaminase domain-containing protein [Candidatus Latescibacterota bacterium]